MKRILSIILMLMIPIMASAEPDKINIEIGGHKVKLDGNAELYRNSTYVSEDLFARSLGIDVRSENEK
ncbi:MAG: hypothetical protein Q4A75_01635, partial [Peptostreptococcaceae bacterium]|nr:hypothetical protein [Peptostreptococcaceae bacterium]